MAQNSSSLISPSLSWSARSIISCSSASSMFSPTSFTTRRRFFMEINPDFSSSNSANTFFRFYLLSLLDRRAVSRSKKRGKSMGPPCSEIAWNSVWFFASNPRAVMEASSSVLVGGVPLESILSVPSQSKRSKASRISSTSSRVMPFFSQSLGLKGGLPLAGVALVFLMKISQRQQNQQAGGLYICQLMATRKRATKSEDAQFKVIMVGRSAAGKSSLLTRYTKNVFNNDYTVTVGVEFAAKLIRIDDNFNVKLQIWDTAGQESFKSIIKSYYRNSSVVFLVYNITRESFVSLEGWLAEARENAPANVMLVLIATHLDMPDSRQVPKEEAEKWMKDNGVSLFFETSSKTAENVVLAFEEVAKQLFLGRMNRTKTTMGSQQVENVVELDPEPAAKANCCK